jgi:hypothetical protein
MSKYAVPVRVCFLQMNSLVIVLAHEEKVAEILDLGYLDYP